MDPTACLKRLLDACEEGDRATAADSLEDLHDWIVRGGFLPLVESKPGYGNSHNAVFNLPLDVIR